MSRDRVSFALRVAVAALLSLSSVGMAQPAPPADPEPTIEPEPTTEPPARQRRTVSEALEEAFQEIGAAEEGGPDAAAHLEKAATLAGYVLMRDEINVRAKFILGRVRLLQGRPREAFGYLKEYVGSREGESDWLGHKLLGDFYISGKYYSMARTKYLRALELNPNERDIHIGLAHAALMMKKYNEAAEHAQRAVDLSESKEPDPRPYFVLAQTKLAAKEFDEAHAAIRRAVDLTRVQIRNDPGDISLLVALKNHLLLERGVLESKQRVYPDQPEPYLAMARVVQEMANVDRLATYHQSISILLAGVEATEPDTPAKLLYETARLQHAVGQNEEAAETLQKLLEKDPDHAVGKKLQEKINQELRRPEPEASLTSPQAPQSSASEDLSPGSPTR